MSVLRRNQKLLLQADQFGSIASMGEARPLVTPLWHLDPTQGILLGVAMFASGGGGATVTLGGTRTQAHDVRVTIDSVAGGTGVGQATFTLVIDGVTLGTGILTAASYAAPGGLNILFGAAVYAVGNSWRGQVESWTDTVAGFVFSQATAANRPFYVHSDSRLSGLPGLDFDGSNDSLTCTTAGAWNWLSGGAATHQYRLFFQCAFDVADALNFAVAYANTASTTGFWAWGINTTANGVWILSLNDGAGKNLESSQGSFTPPLLYEAWSTGTQGAMNASGYPAIPLAAQNPGSVTLNNVTIGLRNRSGADGPMNGVIGHVVQFNQTLTDAQALAWRQVLQIPAGLNTVMQSSTLVLTCDQAHAGAGFTTMGINGGGNLVNATDHGRGIQCSASINRDLITSQGYNPTPQGSFADGGGPTSTSVRLFGVAHLGLQSLRTDTLPAFWLDPGMVDAHNGFQPSDWSFSQDWSLAWLGQPGLLFQNLLTTLGSLVQVPPAAANQIVIEDLTCYVAKANFDTVERYNPATLTFTTVTAAEMNPAGPTFFNEPLIVSNSVGTDRAVLVYTIDPSPMGRGYRCLDTGSLYVPDHQWQLYGSIQPYTQYRNRNFLGGGTKAAVVGYANLLYATYGVF